jgi:hypothetical protein
MRQQGKQAVDFEKSHNVEKQRQNPTSAVIFRPFHKFPFVETTVDFQKNLHILPFFRALLKSKHQSTPFSPIFLL